MDPESRPQFLWQVDLPDEQATAKLARDIAAFVHADDLITLSGTLGAGKTTFARALIRHILRDPGVEVPSPTYTLMQVYQGIDYPVVHADLYRIQDASELSELGWEEAADGALVLVEWADRAGGQLPPDRLDISFDLDQRRGSDFRTAVITGSGTFAARVLRARAIDALLTRVGWEDARRTFMLGDASIRAYERLTKENGDTAVLMISPARPDGPPLRSGKSYSQIARLAENVRPFVAVDQALRSQALSAPEIYGYDLDAGLAVLEDLGSESVVDSGRPIPDRYASATSVLATLHAIDLPDAISIEGESDLNYVVPPYDIDALLIEIELVLDWYAPHCRQLNISSSARATFLSLWRKLLDDHVIGGRTWTLRDYHSPNLIWLPQREGLQQVGILDFQDCVIGHPAYDVVSLLQDARVTVTDELELRLLTQYARQRRTSDTSFDMAAFAAAYAVLGAQRATKIIGIFARLNDRDHKPQYLAHIPRVIGYLAKDLAHPVLAEIKVWYETHLPQAVTLAD